MLFLAFFERFIFSMKQGVLFVFSGIHFYLQGRNWGV